MISGPLCLKYKKAPKLWAFMQIDDGFKFMIV